MKKLFLAAVLGASALFVACGDDSSTNTNTDPQTETDKPSGGDCFSLPEPNGESHQGCWYTSDATTATRFEVTAVGVITKTWTVEGGKVTKTTNYDDGNEPSIEDEPDLSSLEDAIEEARDYNCKKIKTAMCK
ncbi:hypothetical protein [uncultured Fibrobacter sp.]|uniref:hypothetical protein n=1 Tax=uncultured Fibrobacter sp. TaxID=261512 RepID=UPI0025D23146|nr:hypothetical protein [uncultured Fibrobacter sp.]